MSSKADKRARKKAVRDARIAQALAKQRRRRMALLGGVIGVVAVIVGLALFTGDGDEAASGECWDEAARAGQKSYNEAPQMVIDEETDYSAAVATTEGDFSMDLLEGGAPKTVNNFVCLARDDFYDNVIWHRVVKDRIIQTGDPQGTGQGGPGYEITDELPEGGENPYTFGAVAMANAGPNTGGSQFFVVVTDPDPKGGFDPAELPPSYSVFGRVDPEDNASTETVLSIANVEVQGGAGPTGTQPVEQVVIESIEIQEASR